jgi:hypothetical protein
MLKDFVPDNRNNHLTLQRWVTNFKPPLSDHFLSSGDNSYLKLIINFCDTSSASKKNSYLRESNTNATFNPGR